MRDKGVGSIINVASEDGIRPRIGAGVYSISKAAVIILQVMLGIHFGDSDLVFSQPSGEPLLPDAVSQAWTRIAKRIGLEGIRLHDARHSHASLMLKQGVHPKIVQERLGHASIQTTLDTYSHVAPGLQDAAAARFDEMVSPKREKEAVKNLG